MPFEPRINPEAQKLQWKEKFVERYRKLTDWEEYVRVSTTFLPKAIRVNTIKTTVAQLNNRLEQDWWLKPIPWCPEGFLIQHKQDRLDVGNTVQHALGHYYVQEAASMIPPVVLSPQPGDTVLDLCAAPGSKTSQMAQMMNNTGIIVANDIKGNRLAPLGLNLQRMGVMNCIITLMRGEAMTGAYDKILVDAPCSGTGTIRKSLRTVDMWNPDMIKRLAATQKKLLARAYTLLKPGGTLVYSTCSTEPEEDEEVISWFLDKNPDAQLQQITLPLKRGQPVMEFNGTTYHKKVKDCLRLWPQDNDTEGFFVAKILKSQ
ncbi:RsmB/NOP family class I SAM-dependent RNA methyltransferase [Candidatus Woesearchaeota archaeon]|nr:RsmB/NOP family class I SAM-dependent RNA methyltransferase [Candidatus Woesearchaeota archaeon]